jgi:hypothetical protein
MLLIFFRENKKRLNNLGLMILILIKMNNFKIEQLYIKFKYLL